MIRSGKLIVYLFLVVFLGVLFFFLRPWGLSFPLPERALPENPEKGQENAVKGGKAAAQLVIEGPKRKEIFRGGYCLLQVVEKKSGRPLAAAEIYVNPRRFAPSLKWGKKLGATDRWGKFEVLKRRFSPGRDVLLVSKEGYRTKVVPNPGEGKLFRIPLEKGATLEIDLVEPGGKAIPGIPVALSSFFPVRGQKIFDVLKRGNLPSTPPKFPVFQLEKSDRKGRCFFSGLDPEKRYGVWVLTRTMTAIDRKPMVPRGDSGKMVITLAPLFGIWAEFEGDTFEAGGPNLSPEFNRRLSQPFLMNFPLITGRSREELRKTLFFFAVPAYRKDGSLKAGLPEGRVPCTVILAKKGRLTIPLMMRRVTPGFAPQRVNVSRFPDDPSMGAVRLSLSNPDGTNLPFTDGFFRLELRMLKKGGRPVVKGRDWPDYVWELSRLPHYIPKGKYEINFIGSPWGRMLRAYLAEESKTIRVKAGESIDCVLKMKKQLVPLNFRFLGTGRVKLSYGVLDIIPAEPGNLSRLHGEGKFGSIGRGFVGFGFPADPVISWRIEDIVCYAPEGEEVLVKFKPDRVYGVQEFEERMVFYRRPGIQVVERIIGGRR